MPSLPVSDFWQRSFYEFYCFNWSQSSDRRKFDKQLKALNRCSESVMESLLNTQLRQLEEHSSDYARCHKWLWKAYYSKPMLFCMLSSLLIYFVVLLVPLCNFWQEEEEEESSKLNWRLYVLLQALYTGLSYFVQELLWEFSLLPSLLRYGASSSRRQHLLLTKLFLPLFTLGVAVFVYVEYGLTRVNVAKIMGPTLQGLIINCYYTAVCLRLIWRSVQARSSSSSFENNQHGKKSEKKKEKEEEIDDFVGLRKPLLSPPPGLKGEEGEQDIEDISQLDPYELARVVAFCWLFQLSISFTYMICILLTFKSSKSSASRIDAIYPMWYAFMMLIKFVAKRLARVIDSYNAKQLRIARKRKQVRRSTMINSPRLSTLSSTSSSSAAAVAAVTMTESLANAAMEEASCFNNELYSCELACEFNIDMFYFVFYRNLFLNVGSVWNFFVLKTIHLSGELVINALRMSHTYFELTSRWQDSDAMKQMLCCASSLVYDPSPYNVWCVRVSLDYTTRLFASLSSSIAFVLGAVWTKRGYNKHFYDYSDVTGREFYRALVLVTVSVVIDLVFAYGMDFSVTRSFSVDFTRVWRLLIRNKVMYAFYFTVVAQHIMSDVFIGKLEVKKHV